MRSVAYDVGMATQTSPTERKRYLGKQLRTLRDNARVTQKVAAERLSCNVGKIIDLEAGKRGLRALDLDALLDLYQVTDPQLRADLHQVAKDARQHGWWVREPYRADPATGVYVGFETAASEVKVWSPWVLPGLVQTEPYARAVIQATFRNMGSDDVERRIRLRLERQRRILDRELGLYAVIDEPVLKRAYCGDLHMRGQLEHLLDMSIWPNVSIQVLPLSPAPPIARAQFALLTVDGDDLLHSEALIGDTWADDPPAVKSASLTFNELRASAQDQRTSRRIMRDALTDMGGPIDGPQSTIQKEYLQRHGIMRGVSQNEGRFGAGT